MIICFIIISSSSSGSSSGSSGSSSSSMNKQQRTPLASVSDCLSTENRETRSSEFESNSFLNVEGGFPQCAA